MIQASSRSQLVAKEGWVKAGRAPRRLLAESLSWSTWGNFLILEGRYLPFKIGGTPCLFTPCKPFWCVTFVQINLRMSSYTAPGGVSILVVVDSAPQLG